MDKSLCSICHSTENNALFQSKDLQIPGTEIFTYLECGNCGCVQITNKPDDLSKHYPANYYSHSVTYPPKRTMKWRKNRLRARNITGTPNIQGAVLGLLDKFSKNKRGDALVPLKCAVKAGAVFSSSILDVGCGTGFNVLLAASRLTISPCASCRSAKCKRRNKKGSPPEG